MANIFISYSHNDTNEVAELAAELRLFGHQILGDMEILPGHRWRQYLDHQLREAEVVVFFITQNSIQSQSLMVEIETARSINLMKDRFTLLIPVMIGSFPIPAMLDDIQFLRSNEFNAASIALQINRVVTIYQLNKVQREEEKEEIKERIEKNAGEYIEETMEELRTREKRFNTAATIWYISGYATLVLGVVTAVYFMTASLAFMTTTLNAVPRLIYIGLKSIIIIALLVAASKYSFNLGKSFMNESLRNSDRIHAISFGRFYLRAYGEKATWEELKEVFQYWNIDTTSSFTKLEAGDFDPKFLDAVVSVASVLAAKGEKREKKEKE